MSAINIWYIMKVIINKLILFLLIAFNLYSQSIPDWVLNTNKRYNEDKYLSAVGEGKTLQDAKINTYKNLSKIFSTSIKLDINSIYRYNQYANNINEASIYEESIQLKSDNELFGVDFKDPHYSKAVMEKIKL